MPRSKPNRYARILEEIFAQLFRPGMRSFAFERSEIETVAKRLKISLPKNLGDLIYDFKFRTELPKSITSTAPAGEEWLIRSAGRAVYQFALSKSARIRPNPHLATIKIPDSTPGVIERYALGDEQALLAKVRYNRLLDIFSGVACYSLQNHLRTTAPEIGQVEIDEIYVGIDKQGVHYVFPVQAKGGADQISIVQIEQDLTVCRHRFPQLVCRAIAAQFMEGGRIALFEFTMQNEQVVVLVERHYLLTPARDLQEEEIASYRQLGS